MRRKNPDDRTLLSRIRFTVESAPAWSAGKTGKFLSVRAFDGGRQVGEAQFKVFTKYLQPWNHGVYVEPEYRRRGLASALYQHAEWKAHPTRRYEVRHAPMKDRTSEGRRFVRGRRNPDLITFINPGRLPSRARRRKNPPEAGAKAAWSRFHGADSAKANVIECPDVRGVPEGVMSLGLLDQVEFSPHGRLSFGRNFRDGPWLVSDPGMRKLWIVARTRARLSALAKHKGDRVTAASYYPENAASAKWDGKSAFRHAFGDGGPTPKERWSETWPRLSAVASGAAYALTDAPYRIAQRDGAYWIIG